MAPPRAKNAKDAAKDAAKVSKDEARKERVSRPVLTKYERAKIIGTRAEQLQRNAEAFVPLEEGVRFDPYEVAMQELLARRLPFVLVRHLPDGKTERLHLDDPELQLEPNQ